jgi:glutathione S-transferase
MNALTATERTLYHFPLDPFSRQVRLALGEKRLLWQEVVERFWEMRPEFMALNPAGLPPVLVEEPVGGPTIAVCDSRAVLDHLEETQTEVPLLPSDPAGRAEVRRLQAWFDRKFDFEVNSLLLHEKLEKRITGGGSPDMQAIRAGWNALRSQFAYLEELLDVRDWIGGGDRLSLADIAAAAHISVLDYFGDAPWREFPATKLWYSKIKSRPSFRPLLQDRWPGIPRAAHYDDLDF